MKITRLKNNQAGIVSLVVTMMLIILITIIVLSFSSFSRREERQAVDRQFSTEAYYVAESGINDAIDQLRKTPPGTGLLIDGKDSCNDPASGFEQSLEPTNTIRYSCLLIDPAPRSLEYTSLAKGESKVVPLEREGGGGLAGFSLYWQDPDTTHDTFTGCPTGGQLPPSWTPGTCSAGMLKLELLPLKNGSFTTTDLENDVKVFYVKPGTGALYDQAFNTMNNGDLVSTRCVNNAALSPSHPKLCKFRIRGMGRKVNYLRITPLYRDAAVTICSPDCNNANTGLVGAQSVIDSTGVASDIVRRIQVRVGISGLDGPFPTYAIESREPICKRLSIIRPATAVNNSPGCSRP